MSSPAGNGHAARFAAELRVVLMEGFNHRPGEPAKELVAGAGLKDIPADDMPTAAQKQTS